MFTEDDPGFGTAEDEFRVGCDGQQPDEFDGGRPCAPACCCPPRQADRGRCGRRRDTWVPASPYRRAPARRRLPQGRNGGRNRMASSGSVGPISSRQATGGRSTLRAIVRSANAAAPLLQSDGSESRLPTIPDCSNPRVNPPLDRFLPGCRSILRLLIKPAGLLGDDLIRNPWLFRRFGSTAGQAPSPPSSGASRPVAESFECRRHRGRQAGRPPALLLSSSEGSGTSAEHWLAAPFDPLRRHRSRCLTG